MTLKRLLLTLLLMWPVTGHAVEKMCAAAVDAYYRNRMPCLVSTISWVEVRHQGDHADIFHKEKANLERFIRLRLRNDLSALSHETLDDESPRRMALKKFRKGDWSVDAFGDFMNPRASLFCDLWWIGNDDYPVAQLTECQLFGYGNYSSLHKNIESRFLGYSNSARLIGQTKDSIRDSIESIASRFYEWRDMEATKYLAPPTEEQFYEWRDMELPE